MLLDRTKPREAGLHKFRGLFHPLELADPYDILIIRRGHPLDGQMFICIQFLLDIADNPLDDETVHQIIVDELRAL